MKQNEQFSVAVHALLYLTLKPNEPVSSTAIAESVNTNPVVIRRILGNLQKAGLVQMKRGNGGAMLKMPAKDITLLHVYEALNMQSNLCLHSNVNTNCAIGAKINNYLNDVFFGMNNAIKAELKQQTILNIVKQHFNEVK